MVFVNKSKGVCQLQIISSGRPAHSSRIWEGRNAIEPIVELCKELLKRYVQNNKRETWDTTFNIAKISGGISTNQVCSQAEVLFDFRFPENTSYKKIENEVLTIAKKINSGLSIKLLAHSDPTYVEVKNKIVLLLIRAFEKSFNKKIKVAGTYGASDSRHFASLRIPILMIKPMGGDIHGSNEHVDINSCMTYYTALESFIRDLTL